MSETKPAYSPGLEGVIAGESAICWVDPAAGLMYRGYDVHDLAKSASFEQVVWLLIHGELPTSQQFDEVKRDLFANRSLPDAVKVALRLLPPNTHPIDALRTGVSMLAAYDPELNDHSHDANVRKAMRIISRMFTLTTSYYRIAKGEAPNDNMAFHPLAFRFLMELTDREPEPWKVRAMDVVLILYAEHEFNASTFAARVTASTLSDIYSAVCSALGALKGPLHGGANEEAMKMIRDIGSPEKAEAWVKDRLARKEKIMGFGHRVYKKGDSRVPVMRNVARDLAKRYGQEQLVAICEKLEEVMEREKALYSNLDLYAAPVLHLLGMPAEIDISVFACGRASGWCAHITEQHDHNRIIRPRCIYTGPQRREMPGAAGK
jgi:2-methylcitrate synthase/citrate synthase II